MPSDLWCASWLIEARAPNGSVTTASAGRMEHAEQFVDPVARWTLLPQCSDQASMTAHADHRADCEMGPKAGPAAYMSRL